MGMITKDMRDIVEGSQLGFVASTCADGWPNLSPKGSVNVYDDDHLLFADIASPTTVENVRRDPRVEVNCVHFLRRRGYRFRGTAQVIEPGSGSEYDEIANWLKAKHGPAFSVYRAVKIKVNRVIPVQSPAYTVGCQHEAQVISEWRERYLDDKRGAMA